MNRGHTVHKDGWPRYRSCNSCALGNPRFIGHLGYIVGLAHAKSSHPAQSHVQIPPFITDIGP